MSQTCQCCLWGPMHHFVLYDNRGFWSHNFHVAHHAQWIGEKLLRSKKCTSSTQFGVQRISCETRASSSDPFFSNKCMGHWPTGGGLKGAFFVVVVDKKRVGWDYFYVHWNFLTVFNSIFFTKRKLVFMVKKMLLSNHSTNIILYLINHLP